MAHDFEGVAKRRPRLPEQLPGETLQDSFDRVTTEFKNEARRLREAISIERAKITGDVAHSENMSNLVDRLDAVDQCLAKMLSFARAIRGTDPNIVSNIF